MTELKPFVSIIVPCRHEFTWIARCLDSLLGQNYPQQRLEVLVVDGMSTDGTRSVIERYVERHACVRLLDNPGLSAPAALNIGIAEAKGDIIMRVDAHYQYPDDYVSTLIHWSELSGADNVGGVFQLEPANDSAIARAIAIAVRHPFGVGNAHYRLGATEVRSVDTVPFGCYKKQVFERIGTFDEELVRCQDNEFNMRLCCAGGTILLVPGVIISGHARPTLGKMMRTFYQYNYYNPLVARKLGGRVTLRQATTPLFAASLLISGLLALWLPAMRLVLAAILLTYGTLVLGFSLRAALKHGLASGLALCIVFPALHLSHGLGFLKGSLDFLILRRNPKKIGDRLPLTR